MVKEAEEMKTSLYKIVKNKLFDAIVQGNYSVGDLLPSEKQLCQLYGVSLITSRRALDELVKEGLVEKKKGKGSVVISLSAQVMSIKGKPTQSGSQSANKLKIGVLMLGFKKVIYPSTLNFNNNWGSKIIYGLKRVMGEAEIYMDFMLLEQVSERYAFSPISKVEKIILLGAWDRPLVQFLQGQGKKVVIYNNFDEEIKAPSVNNNEHDACYQAVSHFIQKGHKNIAVINGFFDYSESKERYSGFQNALFDHRIDLLPYFVKWGDYTPENGYILMKELLEAPNRPTAVFCANDTVAGGAYHAIVEAGLKCPEDMSLFGHDNLEFSETIGLSSIDPLYEEVGIQLGKLIMEENGEPISSSGSIHIIQSQIIHRRSVLTLKEQEKTAASLPVI